MKIELTQEDYDKDEVMDNLMESDIEKLSAKHAEDYHGLDDNMPDAFENWLTNLTSKEILDIIK